MLEQSCGSDKSSIMFPIKTPDRTWRCQPGHLWHKWLDQLQDDSIHSTGDLRWGLAAVGALLQATSRVPRWWIGERPPDIVASCDDDDRLTAFDPGQPG